MIFLTRLFPILLVSNIIIIQKWEIFALAGKIHINISLVIYLYIFNDIFQNYNISCIIYIDLNDFLSL